MLVVVTRECPEEERGNALRSQLLLLASIAIGVLAFVAQRYHMFESVKHLME